MHHSDIVGFVKDQFLPITNWASAKAAWCYQPEYFAPCIPPDYTDSSRTGRYCELGHLESTIPAQPKHHRLLALQILKIKNRFSGV